MALTLGTNCGFVTTAPTTDPDGSATQTADGNAVFIRHTSPTGSFRITEIGFYTPSTATEAGTNWEVGLYASDGAVVPGEAGTRLQVDATNAMTAGAGWKVVSGLNWALTTGTVYWIGVQVDNATATVSVDTAISGGSGYEVIGSQTALANPAGGGAIADADGLMAIYALVVSEGGAHHRVIGSGVF